MILAATLGSGLILGKNVQSLSLRMERYIIAVVIVFTAVYLLIEVGFTSYLIEFLGKPRTPEEILEIEQHGRMLTGTAVALLPLKFVISHFVGRFGLTWRAAAFAMVSMLAVWAASYQIVATSIEHAVLYLTDQTTSAQRRDALLVAAAVDRLHAVENGTPVLTMNGEFIPDVLTRNHESRVVLAALPFLISKVPHLEERLSGTLERVISQGVVSNFGAPQRAYNDLFVRPMQDLIAPTYNGYVRAVNEYRKARYERFQKADQDFDEYREELVKNRLTVDRAKRVPRIRKKVADRLIEKNIHFKSICDRKGLPDSVADFDEVVENTIRDEFHKAMVRLDISGMAPPDGDFSIKDFIASQSVVALWNSRLKSHAEIDAGLVELAAQFGPRVGASADLFKSYQARVIDPHIKTIIDGKVDDFRREVAAYLGNSDLGTRAYSSMKALIVIPIAILCSMAGALTHMGKLIYLSALCRIGRAVSAAFALIVVLLVIVTASTQDTRDFKRWKASEMIVAAIGDKFGPKGILALNITLSVQSKLYPIGLEIRRKTAFIGS